MILVCPQCATRYIVPDSAIGAAGRQVRCAACGHSWYQEGAATPQAIAPTPRPQARPQAQPPVPEADERPEVDRVFASAPEPAAVEEDEEAYERPRRNPARWWTAAAVLVFLILSGLAAAVYYYGPPRVLSQWGLLPPPSQDELVVSLTRDPERRPRPGGGDYFAFTARVLNTSDATLVVPPVLVEMRDAQNRLVFSWITRADKSRLKPGEEARIAEARTDIPKNAANMTLTLTDNGW
jgi:predicted Zn finger-like uncharacterized protein